MSVSSQVILHPGAPGGSSGGQEIMREPSDNPGAKRPKDERSTEMRGSQDINVPNSQESAGAKKVCGSQELCENQEI